MNFTTQNLEYYQPVLLVFIYYIILPGDKKYCSGLFTFTSLKSDETQTLWNYYDEMTMNYRKFYNLQGYRVILIIMEIFLFVFNVYYNN